MTDLSHLDADVQAALARDMTIDITTTGARSKQARRIEIWFLNVEGTIYITGSVGPRDWFANLLAEPSFTFHLKESVTADLAATATVVTDEHERRRVFAHPTADWYLRQEDTLDELIAEAPMVRIDFGAA